VVLAAAGAYLRHGTVPVVTAYRVGREVEHLAADPARFGQVFRMAYGIGRRDRLTARRGGTR
jgi:hypothetical protein